MITIQHWSFLGWFLRSFVPFKVGERDNGKGKTRTILNGIFYN